MSNVNEYKTKNFRKKVRGFHLFLPNRGQNKDTIYLSPPPPPPPPSCFLHELFLIFTNFLLRTPLFQLDFLHSGLLVLALYHNLSPLTIFLCYKIVSARSGRMFSLREFPMAGFQLQTRLQAAMMRRAPREPAANRKLINIINMLKRGHQCPIAMPKIAFFKVIFSKPFLIRWFFLD